MATAPSTRGKRLTNIALITGLILLIPLIAMQFTTEVNWSLTDFVFMGMLLFGAGFIFEVLASSIKDSNQKIGVGLAVFAALLLIWVNLAVGIVGSEDTAVNPLYMTIPLIGLVGAYLSRSQSEGMIRTLYTMSAAQAVITILAFTFWDVPEAGRVIGLNVFFIVLYFISAALLRRSK